MIKGDIDLTENLDFYHDKPKKSPNDNHSLSVLLPRIPWDRKPEKKKSYEVDKSEPINTEYDETRWHELFYPEVTWYDNNNGVIDMYPSTIYELGTTPARLSALLFENDRDYITTATYNSTINYINNTNTYTFTTHYPSSSIDISTRYGLNPSSSLISWYNNEDEAISWSSGDSIDSLSYLYLGKIIDKRTNYLNSLGKLKNVFGKDIRYKKEPESAMKKCYYCGAYTLGNCRCRRKEISNYDVLKLLSRTDKIREIKEEEKQDQYDRTTRIIKRNRHKKRSDQSQSWLKRAEALGYHESNIKNIPWLKNLNYRILEDYIRDLYEEQDYSEYLTNMTWIRIH